MIRLCITADDFGLSPGVNDAVVDLFERGALSHTSALVCANHIEDGLKKLPAHFRDRIGLHLCLDEETPISPPERIPTLVTEAGRFKKRGRMLWDIFMNRIKRRDLETEVRAQIRRLMDLGIRPKYLDGHGHLHVLLRVASVVGPIVQESGISMVRRPVEMSSLALAAPPILGRLPVSSLISIAAYRSFRGSYRGLAKTDRFIGLVHSGHLSASVVNSWIRVLKKHESNGRFSTLEVMCHPGFSDDILQKYSHWRYEHESEHRAALLLRDAFHGQIV
jgi:predicted glycoside hydrolase/deacetylase ChbG (UPF0249 family)